MFCTRPMLSSAGFPHLTNQRALWAPGGQLGSLTSRCDFLVVDMFMLLPGVCSEKKNLLWFTGAAWETEWFCRPGEVKRCKPNAYYDSAVRVFFVGWHRLKEVASTFHHPSEHFLLDSCEASRDCFQIPRSKDSQCELGGEPHQTTGIELENREGFPDPPSSWTVW